MNLLKHIDVELASTTVQGVVDGTTSYSQIVDCQGYEGCLFMVVNSTAIGTSKTTCVMMAQGSTGNSTTAMVTYAGRMSLADTTAAIANNRLVLWDLYKPEKRYNRVKIQSNTSGYVTFIALKYGARKPGSTTLNDSTTVLNSTVSIGTT